MNGRQAPNLRSAVNYARKCNEEFNAKGAQNSEKLTTEITEKEGDIRLFFSSFLSFVISLVNIIPLRDMSQN
jgi:hypothetical protein